MADDYAGARPKSVVIEERRFLGRRNLVALSLVATVVPVGVQVPTGGITLTAYPPTITISDPNFIPTVRRTSIWAAEEWQPPRNNAAIELAVVGANNGVNVPTGTLSLTAYPPVITVNGAPALWEPGRFSVVEVGTTQPRRNLAAIYQGIISGPQTGQTVAIPAGSLNLLGFAPTISQATPILTGQDLQEVTHAEVWQPDRRSYLYSLAQPGSQSVNVPTGTINLTGFAPSISVTGTVFVPQGNIALTAFAPVVSQQSSGRVDVPLGALTLTALPPVISVSGTVFVPLAGMVLTAYPPRITQGTATRPPSRRRIVVAGPTRKLSE